MLKFPEGKLKWEDLPESVEFINLSNGHYHIEHITIPKMQKVLDLIVLIHATLLNALHSKLRNQPNAQNTFLNMQKTYYNICFQKQCRIV